MQNVMHVVGQVQGCGPRTPERVGQGSSPISGNADWLGSGAAAYEDERKT